MTRILPTIAALAVLVAIARLARRQDAPIPQADDSEVVGMPTTWSTDPYTPAERDAIAGRWYVELAPTSRN